MKKLQNEKGFTLVELMIVVAIIGILAAIAIPQFNAYRIRGFNSSAQSDLKNAATTQANLSATAQKYGVTYPGTAGKQNCNDGGYAAAQGVVVTGGDATKTAMMCTITNAGAPEGPAMSLGNGVSSFVMTDTVPGIASNTAATWVGVTKHANGDTCYAMDGDFTNVYGKTTPTAGADCAPGKVLATGVAGIAATPTIGALDITIGSTATDWQVK